MNIKAEIKALQEIANEMVTLVKLVMESVVGVNKKVNKNTLKDSDVFKSVKAYPQVDNNIVIYILLNDYIQYIESGRKPKAKKVPISALRDWATKKGLSTENSFLYAVQQNIFKEGIAPRPVMQTFFNELDKAFEKDYYLKVIEIIDKQISLIFK